MTTVSVISFLSTLQILYSLDVTARASPVYCVPAARRRSSTIIHLGSELICV